jgi:hypothetical protein
MKGRAAKPRSSRRLLRWFFREGNQYLSCQPDLDGGQSAYMLSILRHSNVARRNSF